jgi:hypothetical protein
MEYRQYKRHTNNEKKKEIKTLPFVNDQVITAESETLL